MKRRWIDGSAAGEAELDKTSVRPKKGVYDKIEINTFGGDSIEMGRGVPCVPGTVGVD